MAEGNRKVTILEYVEDCGKLLEVTCDNPNVTNITFSDGKVDAFLPDLSGCGHPTSPVEYNLTAKYKAGSKTCEYNFVIRQEANTEKCCDCDAFSFKTTDTSVPWSGSNNFTVSYATDCEGTYTFGLEAEGATVLYSNKTTANLSIPGNTSCDGKSIVLKPKVNGVYCDSLTLTQEGHCVCDDVSVMILIPAEGCRKNDVVGKCNFEVLYDLVITCDNLLLRVDKATGNIIADQDVDENPSETEPKTFKGKITYAGSDCGAIEIVQAPAQCDCSEKLIRNLVIPQTTFFENGYKGEIEIAQYNEVCGTLKIDDLKTNMLESGEDGNAGIILRDDPENPLLKHVFVNMLENKTGAQRSCIINFNLLNTEGENCAYAGVELIQGANFLVCNPGKSSYPKFSDLVIKRDEIHSIAFDFTFYSEINKVLSGGTFVFNGLDNKGAINLASEFGKLPVRARLSKPENYEHTKIRVSAVEIGYFDELYKDTIIKDTSTYSMTFIDLVDYEESDRHVISTDKDEIYKWCVITVANEEDDSDVVYVTINDNNIDYSHKYNYVKVNYDLYTQYDDGFPNSGVYCSTLLSYYVLLDGDYCPNCFTTGLNDNFNVDYDGGKIHLELRKDVAYTKYNFACDMDITNVWVTSDMDGQVIADYARVDSGSIKRENGSIVECDIIVDSNYTLGYRELFVFCSGEKDGYGPCNSMILYRYQNNCIDCSNIYDLLDFKDFKRASEINDSDICSIEPAIKYNLYVYSEEELKSVYNQQNDEYLTYDETKLRATWKIDKPICLSAYFVLCDKNGNEYKIKPNEDTYVKTCGNSKITYYEPSGGYKVDSEGYIIGQQVDGYNGSYATFYCEDTDGTYDENISLYSYYKVKIYKGADYTHSICESDVHFYNAEIVINDRTTEDCVTPTSGNIDSYNVLELHQIVGVNYSPNSDGSYTVVFPKTGGTITCFGLNFTNGDEMGGDICPDYKIKYTITSTVEVVKKAIVNGKNVEITLDGRPEGDTQLEISMSLICEVSNGSKTVTKTTTIKATWES